MSEGTNKRIRVLFAVFEAAPFVKTGGLGDVGGTLPKALQEAGAEVRVILPKFASIPGEYLAAMEHVTDFYLDLSWRRQYCGLDRLEYDGVVYYFVDNLYYFGRSYPYGFYDDGERIAFFSKAICACIPHLDMEPDILHCNDWHTALATVYLREQYRGEPYSRIRTVFTVHNLKFQGQYEAGVLGDVLGLHDCPAARDQLLHDGCVNYMRGALNYADRLTTVSPTYAQEVCTDFYGEGLNDVYNRRRDVLSGILNGIDTVGYDPAHDAALAHPFSADDLRGKAADKRALQRALGLPEDEHIPMLGLVSRLTDQKGLDLVNAIMWELLETEDVQFVVLGVGQPVYEESFRALAARWPEKMSANIRFSDPLSRQIYAASDLILVPSLFEPCGLSQMIAMRYGALPVVRETGGLKDSVIPYNKYTGAGNGFSFANYNAHELLFTLQRALTLYRGDSTAWDALVQHALAADFSWTASAEKYLALYGELVQE